MHLAPVFVLLLCPAPTALESQVIAPYVEVRGQHSVGSGVAIRVGKETLVLTAAHVVSEDGKQEESGITLRQESAGKRLDQDAAIVAFSAPEEYGGHDLALLRPVDAKSLVPAKLGLTKRLTPGQDCWYVGTPAGIHRSLEKSILNRTDYRFKGADFLLVNGNGFVGSSGGPVFVKDADGYVFVGIIVRLAHPHARTPLLAQSPRTIAHFLDDYRAEHK